MSPHCCLTKKNHSQRWWWRAGPRFFSLPFFEDLFFLVSYSSNKGTTFYKYISPKYVVHRHCWRITYNYNWTVYQADKEKKRKTTLPKVNFSNFCVTHTRSTWGRTIFFIWKEIVCFFVWWCGKQSVSSPRGKK